MKPTATERCVSLGVSSLTTAASHASAFASASGRAARAAAACSWPEIVLSARELVGDPGLVGPAGSGPAR